MTNPSRHAELQLFTEWVPGASGGVTPPPAGLTTGRAIPTLAPRGPHFWPMIGAAAGRAGAGRRTPPPTAPAPTNIAAARAESRAAPAAVSPAKNDPPELTWLSGLWSDWRLSAAGSGGRGKQHPSLPLETAVPRWDVHIYGARAGNDTPIQRKINTMY